MPEDHTQAVVALADNGGGFIFQMEFGAATTRAGLGGFHAVLGQAEFRFIFGGPYNFNHGLCLRDQR